MAGALVAGGVSLEQLAAAVIAIAAIAKFVLFIDLPLIVEISNALKSCADQHAKLTLFVFRTR
jgi:hypothetical protein